ncbi:hypothetical protein [Hahella ganghwensis]|uniref:hypothetical protein n=1 Tax=Hahella ganghwensis TaxID=286420 RepID=UPI00035FDE41|nr:hypothetical protein [Hahella ganghwensis]
MNSLFARAIPICLAILLYLMAGKASSQPLNIGIMEAAPWAFLEAPTYQPKGRLVTYARQLFNELQVDYRILVLPTERLNYMAEKGQIDIAITLDDGRIHHFMNPVKLLESVEILALSQRSEKSGKVDWELRSQPLDVIHGYKTDHENHHVSVDLNDAAQLFALLDAKRIDRGYGLKPLLQHGANTRQHNQQLDLARSVGFADILIWSRPRIAPEIPQKLRPVPLSLNI